MHPHRRRLPQQTRWCGYRGCTDDIEEEEFEQYWNLWSMNSIDIRGRISYQYCRIPVPFQDQITQHNFLSQYLFQIHKIKMRKKTCILIYRTVYLRHDTIRKDKAANHRKNSVHLQ